MILHIEANYYLHFRESEAKFRDQNPWCSCWWLWTDSMLRGSGRQSWQRWRLHVNYMSYSFRKSAKKWEAIYFVCQHLKSNLNFSNNSVLKYRVCYVCYNSFDIKIYLRITESSYILVFISKYMRVICLLYVTNWACCTVWLWRVNIEWLYVVSVSFYICFALVKSIIITM